MTLSKKIILKLVKKKRKGRPDIIILVDSDYKTGNAKRYDYIYTNVGSIARVSKQHDNHRLRYTYEIFNSTKRSPQKLYAQGEKIIASNIDRYEQLSIIDKDTLKYLQKTSSTKVLLNMEIGSRGKITRIFHIGSEPKPCDTTPVKERELMPVTDYRHKERSKGMNTTDKIYTEADMIYAISMAIAHPKSTAAEMKFKVEETMKWIKEYK